jgi:hypothetical protein
LTDHELLARLAWVAILPLGIVQMTMAVMIRRRLGRRVLGATAGATCGALFVGLLGALLVKDPRTLLPLASFLYFVPGLPPLVALLRDRMWGLAAVLFAVPPGIVLAFTV